MKNKLTISFPTAIRRSMATVTPRTVVQLGDIRIVFHGNTPIYAQYKKETISCLSHAIKKDDERAAYNQIDANEMPYTQFLFRLNRMLAEQAHSIIDPIMDNALAGEGTLNE